LLPPPWSTLFPYTTLFRSHPARDADDREGAGLPERDRGGRRGRGYGASSPRLPRGRADVPARGAGGRSRWARAEGRARVRAGTRAEEDTSELQSPGDVGGR